MSRSGSQIRVHDSRGRNELLAHCYDAKQARPRHRTQRADTGDTLFLVRVSTATERFNRHRRLCPGRFRCPAAGVATPAAAAVFASCAVRGGTAVALEQVKTGRVAPVFDRSVEERLPRGLRPLLVSQARSSVVVNGYVIVSERFAAEIAHTFRSFCLPSSGPAPHPCCIKAPLEKDPVTSLNSGDANLFMKEKVRRQRKDASTRRPSTTTGNNRNRRRYL